MTSKASSIARNLKITFFVSILLLTISLLSSFLSIQNLIDNSQLMNHTHEVLLESENVISYMKDGETGQRGFLLTQDPSFLEPYTEAKAKALSSCERVRVLTSDNPVQQERCNRIEKLINVKFDQMEIIIRLTEKANTSAEEDSTARYEEMVEGKKIMDNLRIVINQVKADESRLLQSRTESQETYTMYTRILIVVAALISILISIFSYFRIKSDLDQRVAKQLEDERKYQETSDRIADMEIVTDAIAKGDYASRSGDLADDQLGRIGKALNSMAEHLQANFDDLSRHSWLQEGTVQLSDAMRGERNVANLAEKLIDRLTSYLEIPVGTIYIRNKHGVYTLKAAHASHSAPKELKYGEGLSGQALKNKKLEVITDLPENYLPVTSSTGAASPVSLLILPLIFEGESIGVIELGLLRKPEEKEKELLNATMETMSIAINAALDHQTLQELFEETQAQAEELQAQHSELENLNSELEAQALSLQASEEELKVQQEELQQSNAELEARTLQLEEKNKEILNKAEELALSTRYKSEFLANMSHELRTPLNSILLLSRLLADNPENNLNTDQVEYARVIQSSGNGLLWLIDEILDLSKIEAGKMQLEYDRFSVEEMARELKALFQPMANEKSIGLNVETSEDVPQTIETDRMRLEQVLKNLLSNAINFTSEGFVTLRVQKCTDHDRFVCFSVKDTGIGIPKDKQHLVFQAFQQADGSTRRKFGGTGLGLSISRELVKLLGGKIKLSSEPGEGSEFTVYLPIERFREAAETIPEQADSHGNRQPEEGSSAQDSFLAQVIPSSVEDDREDISPGDSCILIVEDDVNFARSVLEYTRKKGYKGVVSVRGDEALPLALRYRPTGILLDIQLPVMSGWEVMDALKNNPETRPIPVHMMSVHNLRRQGLQKGAIDFIEKPMAFEQMQEIFSKIEYVLAKNPKKVLIIEDNTKHAEALAFFLESHNITSDVKTNISESVNALLGNDLDCVILDMGIPASNAYEVLEEVKKNEGLENLPIIIFTGKSLSMTEEQRIRKYADSIVVKTAHSYQRMLDEVSLFLHLVEEKRGIVPSEYKKLGALNEVLNNKTVLIADDDIRNIFSLTKALETLDLKVITSTNGKEALEKLEEHPEIDIVLLDMMMPEMDGYETARRIRGNKAHSNLPIIAVTAKAMTGDREKCIAAGASDYITKPVDVDQLLSLLRVWLYDKA